MSKKKSFYTCKDDKVFKTIFCNSNNPEPMKELLSRILKEEIKTFEFLTNELPVSYVLEKSKRVDCLMLVNNKYVHVELNTETAKFIRVRNYASFSSIFSKNVMVGEEYDVNKQFIHIDISFNLSKKKDCKMNNTVNDHKDDYIENLRLVEFNMDKIIDYWYNNDTEMINKYKHLIVLNLPRKELEKIIEKEDDEFMVYVGKSILELNDQERYAPLITPEEDYILTMNSYKRLARDEGLAEGRAKGLEEGRAAEKNSMALNMLKENCDIAFITRMTKLSEKEVKALQTTL
ncbi:MAG: hypothetical protein IJ574_05745 [Bacilli bacterium]|nr:hypothetical protein [Bacilli bacterium]